MDDTVMTVDFDRPLSKDQLNVLEEAANVCVYRNAEVISRYPSEEEVQMLSYRSKIEDLKHPRIVTIQGYDQCACCAVHVARTGEVGLIKILTAISHRGGVRITLICGITAYRDYAMKHAHTLRIADLLAAKHGETDAAVEKQLQKEKELKWELQQRTEALIGYVKKNEPATNGNRVFCFDHFDPESLKTAAVSLKDVCGGLCVVISGDDCKGYYFAISSASVNVKDFTKSIVSSLNGSGGGRYDVIQGRFNATESEIRSYFSELTVN
jgi:alanyl-tRNA synthetase